MIDEQIQTIGVTALLRRAGASERLRAERKLLPLELTQGQLAILELIDGGGGLTSAKAARAECLTPQTICVIVRNLERRGAIKRYPDTNGGRGQTLHLTALGKDLLVDARGAMAGDEARMLRLFAPAEALVVKRWLSEIIRQRQA